MYLRELLRIFTSGGNELLIIGNYVFIVEFFGAIPIENT
jgi:hypothetical protein